MRIVESEDPVTELDLDRAERRMAIVLPDDLRDFYLGSNGGIPIPDCFKRGDQYYSVSCFHSSVKDVAYSKTGSSSLDQPALTRNS
jgi:hypothetical protein